MVLSEEFARSSRKSSQLRFSYACLFCYRSMINDRHITQEVLSDAAVVRGKELSAIKAHVTRNRLINVLSKRGKAQQQQHDVLCEALLLDVLEEAATKSLLRMYIDGNRKSVEEALAPLCADCVLSWATEQKKKNKK